MVFGALCNVKGGKDGILHFACCLLVLCTAQADSGTLCAVKCVIPKGHSAYRATFDVTRARARLLFRPFNSSEPFVKTDILDHRRRIAQKVGSAQADVKSPRLQGLRRRERDFLRKGGAME